MGPVYGTHPIGGGGGVAGPGAYIYIIYIHYIYYIYTLYIYIHYIYIYSIYHIIPL